QQVPEAPAGLVAVINKALAKDPAQRFQSASQMAVALRSIAQNPNRAIDLEASEPSGTLMETPGTLLATGAAPRPAVSAAWPAGGQPVGATVIKPAGGGGSGGPSTLMLVAGGAIVLVLCLALGGTGALVGSKLLFPGQTATLPVVVSSAVPS